MTFAFKRQSAGAEPRVLVIQGNRSYLGVMARRLAEFGFRVSTAENAQAGLAEMYRVPIDLVLCDVKLTGTSGIELARMVRDDPVHSAVPFILVVEKSDPVAAVNAFRAGADGIVRKPCQFEVLAAAIGRQIERADAVKRLADDNAALDAKVVSRVIELREIRDQLRAAEAERRRLAAIVEGRAA